MATAKKVMTKAQLVDYFAKKFEVSKKVAIDMINEVGELTASQVKKAGVFVLPNICKIVLAKRKARMGRNPKTGEAMKIPAKTVLKARISKALKDAVLPPKK
jgi:DNA-binding protein HU-beta